METIEKNPADALTMSFEGKTFHTGYSRIQKYLQCPKSYKYSYVDKLQRQASVPMKRGTAYHATLDVALKFKIDKGRHLSINKTLELAHYFAEQEGLTESVVGQVLAAVRFWHETLYQLIEPLFVEEVFSIVRNGVTLTGRCDYGTVDGTNGDHKFSANTWPTDRAKKSVQPVIYQWAWEDIFAQKYGVPYKRFEYQIVRSFPGLNAQVIKIGKLNQVDSDWYEAQIREVAEAMCAGVYFGRPEQGNCGKCSYRKECQPVLYRVSEKTFGTHDPDE